MKRSTLTALLIALMLAALALPILAQQARIQQPQAPLAGAAEIDDDDDDEERIELQAAPAAIQAAIQRIVGNNMIVEITREREDGVTEYEVEFMTVAGPQSASLSEAGDLLELEQEVTADALPAAVRQKLAQGFAGASIQEAELVQKVFYEIELTEAGRTREIKIDAAGRLMDDDDDDDDR